MTTAKTQMKRDLWWDARNFTAAMSKQVDDSMLEIPSISISRPGAPVKSEVIMTSLISPNRVAIIDLNKYRKNVNLKAFKEEAGVSDVILRMGGPAQFVADDWDLTEDETWRSYFELARSLEFDSVGGYVVYSAGIDARNYEASEILLNFANECMGRDYIPDYLAVDDEVDWWWENSKKVTVTQTNQIKGLVNLLPKIWSRFKLTPVHYSAGWFIDRIGRSAYANLFDNLNRAAVESNDYFDKTVLNWFAWYLDAVQATNKVYTTAADAMNDLPTFTQAAENKYLNVGSHALYDIHQFASNFITQHCLHPLTKKPLGVDINRTRYNRETWMKMINKKFDTDPGDNDNDDDPGDVSQEVLDRIAALELAYSKLESKFDNHTHSSSIPI